MTEPIKKKNKSWPYGLFIFYTFFIGVVITGVVVLGQKRFDLVSKDYYDDEIAFQDRIDAVSRVRQLAEKPTFVVADHQTVEVIFPASLADRVEKGTVVLYRPSDARKDQQVDLMLDAAGKQSVVLAETQRGLWSVKLSWTMDGLAHYLEEAVILPQLTAVTK